MRASALRTRTSASPNASKKETTRSSASRLSRIAVSVFGKLINGISLQVHPTEHKRPCRTTSGLILFTLSDLALGTLFVIGVFARLHCLASSRLASAHADAGSSQSTVSVQVFREELLVVLLGKIKRRRGNYLGRDRLVSGRGQAMLDRRLAYWFFAAIKTLSFLLIEVQSPIQPQL